MVAPQPTKHVFVTGGVASSLGKGLTASSLGSLLKSRGLRVTMQKLDPYLNVDPGTMNPFQHGEVFVTDDGAETDLDIGHYERFLDTDLEPDRQRHDRAGLLHGDRQGAPRRLPRRHRPGDPAHHQRDQGPHPGDGRARTSTWSSPRSAAPSATSSRCRSSRPRARSATTSAATTCFFLHVSLVPYIGPSRELKTKPTQHSVAALRSIGIQPDAIVCAPTGELPASIKRKISLMCDVDDEAVVTAVDAPSIYDIPKVLHSEGLDAYVVRRLDLPFRDVDWTAVGRPAPAGAPPQRGGDGRPGRQVRRPARRLPVGRARRCGPAASPTRRGSTSAGSPPTTARPPRAPRGTSATSTRSACPGGFGIRGIEGKLGALTYARDPQDPDPGPVPGPAVHGDRVRPPAGRPARRPTRPSSTPTAPSR